MRPPVHDSDDRGERLDELDRVVRQIGENARQVNLDRARSLAAALDRADAGELAEPGREAAAATAHQLVGSAGTFGFRDVSRLAGRVEAFFAAGRFEGWERQVARQQVAELLHQLEAGR